MSYCRLACKAEMLHLESRSNITPGGREVLGARRDGGVIELIRSAVGYGIQHATFSRSRFGELSGREWSVTRLVPTLVTGQLMKLVTTKRSSVNATPDGAKGFKWCLFESCKFMNGMSWCVLLLHHLE